MFGGTGYGYGPGESPASVDMTGGPSPAGGGFSAGTGEQDPSGAW